MRQWIILGATALALAAGDARAATIYWTNNAGGNFADAGNWNPNTVPGATDSAFFTNNATFAVSFATDTTNANVRVTTASATATLNGNTWLVGTDLAVGESTTSISRLTAANGRLQVNGSEYIGYLSGGTRGELMLVSVTNSVGGDFNAGFNNNLTGVVTLTSGSLLEQTNPGSTFYINNGSSLGIVTASNSTITAAGIMYVGYFTGTGMLSLYNSTNLVNNTFTVGQNLGAKGFVSLDQGSLLRQTANLNFSIGFNGGCEGTMTVSNNSVVAARGNTSIGANTGARGTLIMDKSTFIAGGDFSIGGAGTGTVRMTGSQLMLTNGGSGLNIASFSPDTGNGTLTASNSIITVANYVQYGAGGNAIVNLYNSTNTVGSFYTSVGGLETTIINVTSGSLLQETGGGHFHVGYAGTTELNVSNATVITAAQLRVGSFTSGSTGLVRNAGGLIQAPSVSVGSNSVSKGTGTLTISDGGTLEANTIRSGFNSSGQINNNGGVYQFTSVSPTIQTNTAGSITLTNGAISYRNVTTANIFNGQVSNITFAGNNTFELNNATNASITSYTFDSTGDPRNYQRLALVNGGSRWQSTTLNIAGGGALLVSNTVNATVGGAVTIAGQADVVNSKVTFNGAVTISGRYNSDPSTNTYMSDVTVSPSGAMTGGAGDLFDFKKSFYIHSANNAGFNLFASTVQFSGGGVHTNAITGIDTGTNGIYGGNFEYGTLRLAATNDVVCFECGNSPAIASNGLYVGWLDLTGLTNSIPNITTLVTNLLHAPSNINIYYFAGDSRNAYLNNQTFQLTDCNGVSGGFLMAAVPEPSMLLLSTVAASLLLRQRLNRA